MLFFDHKINLRKFLLYKNIYLRKDPIASREISKILNCHLATVDKTIKELNEDLEEMVLKKQGVFYKIATTKTLTIAEYYAKLAINDLPFKIFEELILNGKMHTLDTLADFLFISRSKLYSSIKKINSKFKKINVHIRIEINRKITISGEEIDFFNLIYELLLQKNYFSAHTNIFLSTIVENIYHDLGISKNFVSMKLYQLWWI